MNDVFSTPVIVLSGFLGAGKSTLLNELLLGPNAGSTALIVNEFGDVPIDHDLLAIGRPEAASQSQPTVTTSGCICCTAGSDIRSSLHEILGLESEMGDARLRRVIVETTGLADLAPVVNQIIPGGAPAFGLRDHIVGRRFHLAGCVCVVDMTAVESTLDQHFECAKQIAFADVIILSKGDLFTGDRSDIIRQLREINPVASIVDRNEEGFDIEEIFAARVYVPSKATPEVEEWLALDQVLAEERHSHPEAKPSRHARIRSFTLVREHSVTYAQLSLFMDLLKNAAGTRLLRLKGLVALEDDPERPLVVHAVQHNLHPVRKLEAWPTEDRRTRLVLIGHDIDPGAVSKLFDAMSGRGPEREDPRVTRRRGCFLHWDWRTDLAGSTPSFITCGLTAVTNALTSALDFPSIIGRIP